MNWLLDTIVMPIVQYLWSIAQVTFSQFVVVGFSIVLLSVALYFVTKRIRNRVSYETDVYTTGWIGTPVHELSHAVVALLFLHKINELVLYQPDSADGSLGYVRHSYQKGNVYQEIGGFFIGMAPLLGGAVVLYLLAGYILEVDFLKLTQVPEITISDFSSLGSTQTLIGETWRQVKIVIGQMLTVDNLLNWRFWLFAYVAFAIGSHIVPSPADFDNSCEGLGAFIGLVFMINLVAGIWGGIDQQYIYWVANKISFYSGILFVALVFNGLWLGVIETIHMLRRTQEVAASAAHRISKK